MLTGVKVVRPRLPYGRVRSPPNPRGDSLLLGHRMGSPFPLTAIETVAAAAATLDVVTAATRTRRGSPARCSKHASRHINPAASSSRPLGSPSMPTGLRRCNAVTCGPSSGARFLTRDPLAATTRDPYGYATGNPINAKDPSGLSTCGEFSLGALVDCGAKAGRTARNVASSAPAQATKEFANTAGAVTGGLATVSATLAVAIPITAPVTGVAAGLFEVASTAMDITAAIIECIDYQGSGLDCLGNVAAVAIPFVSGASLRYIERQYGDEIQGLMRAAYNSLATAVDGAQAAHQLRPGC